MEWSDFYKFPLMIDEYGSNVIAQPGEMGYRMAFDWVKNPWWDEYPVAGRFGYELAKQIVRILNKECPSNVTQFKWTVNDEDPTVININGHPCIMIRGYGELTGTGALHLPRYEADKIQDDFRDYIIKTLSGK